MRKQWILNQESFDRLLDWFDSDREQAGQKYEDIRQSLIKVFAWRGFNNAEDLADETINRVSQKVDAVATDYEGDPALYFHGVAKKLMLEGGRTERSQELPATLSSQPDSFADEVNERERMGDCLDACLAKLSQSDRELVLSYYREAKQLKIDFRKAMAEQLELTPNNLRVRMHRLRARIHNCMLRCLQRKESGATD